MRKPAPLSRWDRAVAAFLTSQRALGRAYQAEEYALNLVRKFLVEADADDLTGALFDGWRHSCAHLSISTRLRWERILHKFCRHRRRTELGCFLPDPHSFVQLKPYPLPRIVSRSQVAQLLSACSPRRRRGRRSRLHGQIMRCAVVLLYTAGLRRGEIVRLTLGDVDATTGVLRIRDSKFHKSRWVPLSSSATRELQRYLRVRRRAGFDRRPEAPLFCTLAGEAYGGVAFRTRFLALCQAAGVRGSDGRCPRLHDMRHSFAVGALLRWYDNDQDVQVQLPRLAMYMGHISIASTAYYLRVMPAVMQRASERFARSCPHLLEGGVT
ncbi:MAG TPA: tyrosine-type recombinase/integrase [Steroidobacteraceae bacterium]|nr:tyrosine-type recombinase/integrase [Steroidobacteraceae bacterium]